MVREKKCASLIMVDFGHFQVRCGPADQVEHVLPGKCLPATAPSGIMVSSSRAQQVTAAMFVDKASNSSEPPSAYLTPQNLKITVSLTVFRGECVSQIRFQTLLRHQI